MNISTPNKNEVSSPIPLKTITTPMRFKNLVKASVPLTCAGYVALDMLTGARQALGQVRTHSGTPHAGTSVDDSVDYIERVTRSYLDIANLAHFAGTIAEIGPGDNLGVALLMLAKGASEVHAIDRFWANRDNEAQTLIYRALSQKYALESFFDGPPSEKNIRGVRYIYGNAAEDYFAKTPEQYTAIVSTAVMEHLYDPILGLDRMLGALKPGGTMIHYVDLRDHGMFAGHHPLTFLTVPGWIYRRMVVNGGRPNRILLHRYKEWAMKAHVEYRFFVNLLVDLNEAFPPTPWDAIQPERRQLALKAVRQMRPRFDSEFRKIADDDLAVGAFAMVVTKRL